jgi:spore coat protein U-like protein
MLNKLLKPKVKAQTLLPVSLGLILAVSMNINANAGTSNASAQATATISSSCQITAQNLSFGNLVLPLSAQSASTSMNVLCSKNASYTVGLAYGGIYGQAGTPTAFYLWNGSEYVITNYPQNNKVLGFASTLPAGAVASTNPDPRSYSSSYTVGGSYGYGKMTGVANGDTIGYFIQVPNQPAQVWNTGNSSYSASGTGSNQTIPVVGTLVPAQSGSAYPTPDMYMDTVTATVSF